MALKFYTNVAKGLKLKVRAFLGLILTFAEVTGRKTERGGGVPPILNRVKTSVIQSISKRNDCVPHTSLDTRK